jgi:hypothetical protein
VHQQVLGELRQRISILDPVQESDEFREVEFTMATLPDPDGVIKIMKNPPRHLVMS